MIFSAYFIHYKNLIIIELGNIYDFEILIHLVYCKLMVDMPNPVIDKSPIIGFIELVQCIFKIKKNDKCVEILDKFTKSSWQDEFISPCVR